MAQSRYYSSTARKTALAAQVDSSSTTIVVNQAQGFPATFPFTLIIDRDTIDEEVVECTAAAGSTLTITRGVDGTTPVAHSVGAQVEHGVSARDFRESRQHEAASTNVHGLGIGQAVVGDTTTQTLTNKTLTSPTVNSPTVTSATISLGANLDAASNKVVNLADPTSAQDAVTKNWAETAATSFVTQASTQATNSANSATASATSATQSAASASASASSASASQTSRLASEAAQTAAEAAQTAAEAAESNAAVSESNSAASAALANDWATKTTSAVAGGEFSAKYHAQDAASSASAASGSASAAASSASAAASSASAAASDAVSAAASASAAAATFDSFDDRYLGVKASDPSVDNDGNALVAGALYFSSSLNLMRVYDGSVWVDTTAVAGKTITVVTSSTRPAGPSEPTYIYESDTNTTLVWNGSAWVTIGGGATGGGNDAVFHENDQVVTANYEITSGKNAGTFGPVTVDSGVTVTIPSGSVWTVV